MNYDYNNLIREQVYSLKESLGLQYEIEVDEEQAFLKKKDLNPNTIYVLTKDLQNDLEIGVNTQPVQILILSEQDSLDIAKSFFSEYAKRYNFNASSTSYKDSGNVTHYIWVKQQYSEPVVLSNFNTIDYGYRSVLYIACNLFIMDDVVDLHDLKIGVYNDGFDITYGNYKALTWNMSYSMTPNTQQTAGSNEFISKSVKSVSSLSIAITMPVTESTLITQAFLIMAEADGTSTDLSDDLSYGGNENFYFDFYLGQYHFEDLKLKLVSIEYGAAIDNIPTIRLGFMK